MNTNAIRGSHSHCVNVPKIHQLMAYPSLQQPSATTREQTKQGDLWLSSFSSATLRYQRSVPVLLVRWALLLFQCTHDNYERGKMKTAMWKHWLWQSGNNIKSVTNTNFADYSHSLSINSCSVPWLLQQLLNAGIATNFKDNGHKFTSFKLVALINTQLHFRQSSIWLLQHKDSRKVTDAWYSWHLSTSVLVHHDRTITSSRVVSRESHGL